MLTRSKTRGSPALALDVVLTRVYNDSNVAFHVREAGKEQIAIGVGGANKAPATVLVGARQGCLWTEGMAAYIGQHTLNTS